MSRSQNTLYSTEVQRGSIARSEIKSWADRIIQAWITRINMLGINDKGRLAQSFRHRIIWEARGADQEEYLHKIQFLFYTYGKFVDYGLGRGVDITTRFHCGLKPEDIERKRKEWIAKPWIAERENLCKIISSETGGLIKAMMRAKYERPGEENTHFKTSGK
ncbi:MAG: hypothetical protein RR354_06475 [Mucinivorans sp.]